FTNLAQKKIQMGRTLTLFFTTFYIFLSIGYQSIAQDVVFPKQTTDKSLPINSANILVDTIFVKVDHYGQKLIEHEVGHGETLYSLAKYYGLSYSDLMFYNMQLESVYLDIGEKIYVPITNQQIIRKKEEGFSEDIHVPVYYKVKPGETLYRISKVYFRMSTDLLKSNNERETDNLKIGEPLLIGWFNTEGIPDSLVNSGESKIIFEANSKLRNYYVRQSEKKKEYFEDGVAFWNTKEKTSTSPSLYALHNKAPLNSVIRIHNPMTNRVLFAKVVGRIPKWTYSNNVKVVLPPFAAKSLGAIDPKFHVKIQYLK
ncbi:MAG: LysM peptidoglycan-binding domain-containing protein, partial [Bacteroidota bacterium]